MVEDVVTQWQDWARDLHLPTKTAADMRGLLAAPPPVADSAADGTEPVLTLKVGLMITDEQRARTMVAMLKTAGVNDPQLLDHDPSIEAMNLTPADVLIIDVGSDRATALHTFLLARKSAGSIHHVIALIPDANETLATEIMPAGATDYLLYGHSASALLARLTNAQRVVTLEHAVRAERELAVSSSGEWARTNRRLLHEALTDPLTQLPNRRYGMDRFAQEWSISTSNGLPIACLMLDIDHFKRVNDQHGHDTGDRVLQQVAQLVERSCRRSDTVFRYGGEEFCVICPGTGRAEAQQLAERILRRIHQESFGKDGDRLSLTISIGVAIRDASLPEFNDLISRADQSLYAAKTAGRDQAIVASQTTMA
jgi:diguanylate cyclase (GGDEF)-like protein